MIIRVQQLPQFFIPNLFAQTIKNGLKTDQ